MRIGYTRAIMSETSVGFWLVSSAVFTELSCAQRAEPITSTGTSEGAISERAAAEGHASRGGAEADNPRASAEKVRAADALGVVRSIGPTHCEVPRAVLFDGKDCLLAQPRLTPYAVEGQVLGFRNDSIPSRSVYAVCGIRSGDVWTKINGEPLDSPERALRIYPKLRESEQLKIELLRGAQSLEVQLDLR